MCGIVGILRARGRVADRSTIEGMLSSIGHRGPDEASIMLARSLGMAAARLAINDLSDAGGQPFGDSHAALTFNGEIYNHRDLRRHLEQHGTVFRGHSDTEVLFHALCRWGVADTLPKLRGMFAFAFADLDRQTISLGRDRLGIKPMLWCQVDGGLAWASEAKALSPVRPLEPDPIQALFAVAGRIDRSPTLTAFQGVRQVPPGHFLYASTEIQPRITEWWSLTDEVDRALYDELDQLGTEELADRLDGLLTGAVQRMGGSDVAEGAFLSGGIDSSLIAAIAGEVATSPPALFTADVGGARSEASAARRTADHLGQPLTVTAFPRNALLDDWATATWHLEAPVITHVNALPYRRLAQAAHDHGVKTALTGEGADELFCGYTDSAAARYRRVLGAPATARRWAAERLPDPYRSALASRRSNQADFLVDLVGSFSGARLESAGSAAFAFLAPRAADRQGRVLAWLGEHLLTLLHRNDAMGMAASVETRFPFLDEDVVRFGINLPTRAKIAVSRHLGNRKHPFVQDKAIVRRVAARRLPAEVADRAKNGFPMYGHQHVRLAPAFWSDGYVVDLLGLADDAADRLGTDVEPYHVAKLASVEVFGRLFALGQRADQVTEHVRRHGQVVL